MFLISAFVPYSVAPRRRIETLASQRSEPSSIFTSLTPSCAERARKRLEVRDRLVGAAHVGLAERTPSAARRRG